MKEKPEERMPVAVQEEVPKKEAAVENLEHWRSDMGIAI
jgi:hypothetical protein